MSETTVRPTSAAPADGSAHYTARIPFRGRRVLMLQGPMGPFFSWLARDLREQGSEVARLTFNAGDALFCRGPARAYRGSMEGFAAYLERLLDAQPVDLILLFGDGRPLHRAAIDVAQRRGLSVVVLEEGYLRPNYITAERGGVNGYSPMSRDPAFFREYAEAHVPEPTAVPSAFGATAWYSIAYSIALTLGAFLYPRYHHHRSLNAFAEAYRWVIGWVRKLYYARKERGVLEWLEGAYARRYFVLTLQVYCDYQLRHSPFASIEQFIDEALRSFAAHAPADRLLVVKHHPLDRPYRDYTPLLCELSERYGLRERVVYVHDVHLPTLLRAAAGTVMINSTVGLQAAAYGTPVKVLGTAVYDLPGITSQVPLDAFWSDPGPVDGPTFLGFRRYLLRQSQVNGSFYRPLSRAQSHSGLLWPTTWGSEPDG